MDEERKIISENPCDGIEPYTVIEKPIDHMEATDVEKLKLGCIRKRDRALIEFMRSTAMRRGEVPLVKISDIDFRSGKIVIFGEKHKSIGLFSWTMWQYIMFGNI